MEATSVNLHITNFVRPLRVPQVREFIEEHCRVEFFWMDSIKSQCYVVTSSLEEAIKTYEALNGKTWPPETGKKLKVSYVPRSELPLQDFKIKTPLDSKWLKTQAEPKIYYKPRCRDKRSRQ